jgi:hypothetical protein
MTIDLIPIGFIPTGLIMIGFSSLGYVCASFFYFFYSAGPGISFPFAGMGPHESEGSRSPSPLNEVKRFFFSSSSDQIKSDYII